MAVRIRTGMSGWVMESPDAPTPEQALFMLIAAYGVENVWAQLASDYRDDNPFWEDVQMLRYQVEGVE